MTAARGRFVYVAALGVSAVVSALAALDRMQNVLTLPKLVQTFLETLGEHVPGDVAFGVGGGLLMMPTALWATACIERWQVKFVAPRLTALTLVLIALGWLFLGAGHARDRAPSPAPVRAPALTIVLAELRSDCREAPAPDGVRSMAVCGPDDGPDEMTVRVYRSRQELMAAWRASAASPARPLPRRTFRIRSQVWDAVDGNAAGRVSAYTLYDGPAHVDWIDVEHLALARLVDEQGRLRRLLAWWANGRPLRR